MAFHVLRFIVALRLRQRSQQSQNRTSNAQRMLLMLRACNGEVIALLKSAAMSTLWQDLSYSLRGFRQNPVFTIIALCSLALGIGANTAIFSLMDQALLRSLPVKHPDQLVLFTYSGSRQGRINTNYGNEYTFSYPIYR